MVRILVNTLSYLSLDTSDPFQHELLARFNHIGGNIRYILSESKTIDTIKREIKVAVARLSPTDLKDLGDLDVGGMVPSLCYMIHPLDPTGCLGTHLSLFSC